jgi:hypothetical protein
LQLFDPCVAHGRLWPLFRQCSSTSATSTRIQTSRCPRLLVILGLYPFSMQFSRLARISLCLCGHRIRVPLAREAPGSVESRVESLKAVVTAGSSFHAPNKRGGNRSLSEFRPCRMTGLGHCLTKKGRKFFTKGHDPGLNWLMSESSE